jgi:hypothetical protein
LTTDCLSAGKSRHRMEKIAPLFGMPELVHTWSTTVIVRMHSIDVNIVLIERMSNGLMGQISEAVSTFLQPGLF